MPSIGMDELRSALRRHFGHAHFRPGQERLVRAALDGRDALGILPTGGGKSVTYLLPAALRPGLVVVLSPLVSLMQDQVERAARARVPAGALHGGVPPAERRQVLARARRGDVRVLFMAPERWASGRIRALLDEVDIRLVAIDEAHCVVTWGYDFRPAYRALGGVGQQVGAPVLAVTATATPDMSAELERALALRDPIRVVRSFDRPNLRWSVVAVRDERERWLRLAGQVVDAPGPVLVYTGTRPQTEAVRAGLARLGVDAEAYHAGLPQPERARVQGRFLGGSCRAVVATNAFGMGVDKADVRRVVHWQAPGSLEAYYQEAGRAGRDGLTADCVVLAGRGDHRLHRRFIDRSHPGRTAVRSAALGRLSALRRYLSARECRRKRLLAYFGEVCPPGGPGCCDRCDSTLRGPRGAL